MLSRAHGSHLSTCLVWVEGAGRHCFARFGFPKMTRVRTQAEVSRGDNFEKICCGDCYRRRSMITRRPLFVVTCRMLQRYYFIWNVCSLTYFIVYYHSTAIIRGNMSNVAKVLFYLECLFTDLFHRVFCVTSATHVS